ncbi:MAG: hypothetical protein RLZZ164_128 [Actinomycetota bacterium]|jgi:cell division protein FtsW (lipid II flippase)
MRNRTTRQPNRRTPARGRNQRAQLGSRAEVAVAVSREFFLSAFRGQSREFTQLLGITIALLAIGMLMVLDASYVNSLSSGSDAYSSGLRQAIIATVGFVGLTFISTLPVHRFSEWARYLMMGSMGLQVITLLFGQSVNGNRNWINIPLIGPVQPSEFMKIAIVLQVAAILTQTSNGWHDFMYSWGKAGIWAILGAILVIAGADLGTVIIMAMFVLIEMALAGLPKPWLNMAMVLGVLGAIAGSFSNSSRRARTIAWLNPSAPDPLDVNWQAKHGVWALAAGGFGGSGLGQSKMKWSWIPEVENDYIFAIIGEEFGLIGSAVVIALFVALSIVLIRILRRTEDMFSRIVVGGVTGWLVFQALVNIAVVLSLLPVLGVPLPLISKGGSSLLANLAAIGVVLAIERNNHSPMRGPRLRQTKSGATGTRAATSRASGARTR